MRLYAYRLALELGYANVDVMLGEMDAHHLTEWMAVGVVDEEERRRDELARKARAGVEAPRRRR